MEIPFVYLNGAFIPEDQAFIPVTDRGFLFGEGIFTTLKVAEGVPQYWQLHLQRLEEQCRCLEIPPPGIGASHLGQLIALNHALEGVWRLKIIATAGSALMSIQPYIEKHTSCRLVLYPHPVFSPTSRLKTLAYLDRLWLSRYAKECGADDVLVQDAQGFLLETSHANIFWRFENILTMPDETLPLMPGVTSKLVKGAALALGMDVKHVRAKLADIPDRAQVYICNSLKGIVPVQSIEDRSFQQDSSWENQLRQQASSFFSLAPPFESRYHFKVD